jgi:alpha-beta hydrolase superfamily lysophospholipase
MLRWFEHSQVYHPNRELIATAGALNRPFEDVHFKSKDGLKLNGWFFPGDTNSSRSGMVVLVCHGNGGNISHRVVMCEALLRTGASLFIFDYRGFGLSEGKPGEEGTYLDAQAAFQWLLTKGFLGSQVIAYGESLGGGIASELAIRENIGGLVLQSTFSCLPDIGAELFPWVARSPHQHHQIQYLRPIASNQSAGLDYAQPHRRLDWISSCRKKLQARQSAEALVGVDRQPQRAGQRFQKVSGGSEENV